MPASSSRSGTPRSIKLLSQAAAFTPTAIDDRTPKLVRTSTLAVLGVPEFGGGGAFSRFESRALTDSLVVGPASPHAAKLNAPERMAHTNTDRSTFFIWPFRCGERNETACAIQPLTKPETARTAPSVAPQRWTQCALRISETPHPEENDYDGRRADLSAPARRRTSFKSRVAF